MGYLFGQKRRKVGRLQRQAARCFLVTQEACSVELGTWCWPRVVLIEKRPLTECERSSMNRAARSVGARRVRRLGRNNWIWRLPDDGADAAVFDAGGEMSQLTADYLGVALLTAVLIFCVWWLLR